MLRTEEAHPVPTDAFAINPDLSFRHATEFYCGRAISIRGIKVCLKHITMIKLESYSRAFKENEKSFQLQNCQPLFKIFDKEKRLSAGRTQLLTGPSSL